jgi:AraC-like DNA-binding protein
LLPKRSISRTWKYAEIGPHPATKPPRGPSEDRVAARAVRYACEMAESGLTRAALARKLGVSRAWVTKALRNLPDGDNAGALLAVADREHSG